MTVNLVNLPAEVLLQILKHLSHGDLNRMTRVCRTLYTHGRLVVLSSNLWFIFPPGLQKTLCSGHTSISVEAFQLESEVQEERVTQSSLHSTDIEKGDRHLQVRRWINLSAQCHLFVSGCPTWPTLTSVIMISLPWTPNFSPGPLIPSRIATLDTLTSP